MEVAFTKVSDTRHVVSVRRRDGSVESIELDSRSFLGHDLAHFAVESELGIRGGFWGSVADGSHLTGAGLGGPQLELAERIAGPMQTMLRTEADEQRIADVLRRVAPERADDDLAARLHERLRQLRGHWNATAYGEAMLLDWPDVP